jgi:putative transposase
MTRLVPDQEWWTAAEIADAALPDMPATKRGVNEVADRQNWRGHPDMARRRTARGGGWEYSWRLFPARAQRHLLGKTAPKADTRPGRDEAWRWFEGQPETVKDNARKKLAVLQAVEGLEPAAGSRHLAVTMIAKAQAIGARTIWGWFALVEGIRTDDRLPYLAPRHRAVETAERKKDVSTDFYDLIKSSYLRIGGQSFSQVYRDAKLIAEKKGWAILPERTMRRRVDADVPQHQQIALREGNEALKRMFPHAERDRTAMTAMQVVNADFHKFDVFVRWPAPKGVEPTILRPQIIAFQDVYSGRILSWKLDVSANSTAVMLAAADMIKTYGIPEHVYFDNGREFAAKENTGGAKTRFRFKIAENEMKGVFVALGCQIHWATPYSGQSKLIERAWGQMCDLISRDPRFAGAYTGPGPERKPENYGTRAIDLDAFVKVVEQRIDQFNTMTDRKSDTAYHRSFAEVFDESYAIAPIRIPTREQLLMCLLGAKQVRAHSKSGAIKFEENTYWAPWLVDLAGQQVVIRFNQENLWEGVHVYNATGAYRGHAECREKSGYFSVEQARTQMRARAAWTKSVKQEAEAHRVMTLTQIGALLDEVASDAAPAVEAKVIKPTFGGRGKLAPLPPRPADAPQPDLGDMEAARAAVLSDLTPRLAARKEAQAEETSRQRFKRYLELKAAEARREPLTREQEKFLSLYPTSEEYRTENGAYQDFGDAYFAG